MNPNFDVFARRVTDKFNDLSRFELFTVDVDDLNGAYQRAFPAGTNEIFRVRPEHDCSCCRNFLKNLGGVVAIKDGQRHTLWADHASLPAPYDTVARALHDLVMQQPISGVFRTKQPEYGSKPNWDIKNTNIRWNHLFGQVAARHLCARPDEERGALNTTVQVFKRGLEELTTAAINEVVNLINDNAIYRGQEFSAAVAEFANKKREYERAADKSLFVYEHAGSHAARFRNTVIGTLVDDLSQGVALDDAVRMYESKVAPQNYKRSTALVTPRMIDSALAKLAEMGLENTVYRRLAKIGDVGVNDVLFVDNSSRTKMRGGMNDLRASLMSAVKPQPIKADNATPISVVDFMANVLPKARKIEVLVSNQHKGNFVSLTAPVYPEEGERLFAWDNNFAWSYVDDVTDSIKQRVKQAGGNVDANLRVSLAWFNTNDLDLHAYCPDGHIHYANPLGDRSNRRILDVDMNVLKLVRDPVENLSWVKPRDGVYKISVKNFRRRETNDVGFTLQIACNGLVEEYHHRLDVKQNEEVSCLGFQIYEGKIVNFKLLSPNLQGGSLSSEFWGVKTETFVPVVSVLNSPNHWENSGSIGNKHWFFILENCLNPELIRGMYVEYLRSELMPHRKVFETLAGKMKCAPVDRAEDQLSGLGFSETKRASLVLKVTDATSTRAYQVNF